MGCWGRRFSIGFTQGVSSLGFDPQKSIPASSYRRSRSRSGGRGAPAVSKSVLCSVLELEVRAAGSWEGKECDLGQGPQSWLERPVQTESQGKH